MHNGFINVDNQKMSKSLGNFFTVRDIAKEFDLEAVRMFMLSGAVSQPAQLLAASMIAQAKAALDRLYTARDHLCSSCSKTRHGARAGRGGARSCSRTVERVRAKSFDAAMDDDLNTADAMGKMFELVREANVELDEKQPEAGHFRRTGRPE